MSEFCDDCGDPLEEGNYYSFGSFHKPTANTNPGESAVLCPRCYRCIIGNEDVVGELLDMAKALVGPQQEVVRHAAKEILARRREINRMRTDMVDITMSHGQGLLHISFGISKELLAKQFDVVYDIVMQILQDYRDGRRTYFPKDNTND